MKTYKIRGSHRTEKQVISALGHNPGIHSGCSGKAAFCVKITPDEVVMNPEPE